MTRRALRYERWPEADRRAWEALFTEGGVLDGRGAACHWAAATRKTNRNHYACWLGWLAANEALQEKADPSGRATPETVRAYGRDLRGSLAPRTVAAKLIGLKCVLQRMDPDREWRWLKDLTNILDSWAKPSRDNSHRWLPAERIYAVLLADLERRRNAPQTEYHEVLAYRNTLMLALLFTCPIRVRNIGITRIGVHLIKTGSDWRLQYGDDETKAKRAFGLIVDPKLVPFLEHYLRTTRRLVPGAEAHDYLWPASRRQAMADITVYGTVIKHSRELLGVAINPHGFRTIAATFLAEQSSADALHARALLAHSDISTTAEHYIRASQREASRAITDILREIRDT